MEYEFGVVLAHEIDKKGNLSKESIERLNKGIELYKNKTIKKLIMSGGKVPKSNFYLAKKMKIYAIKFGVMKKDIILENLSKDTVGGLIFLKIGILKPRKIKKSIIISHKEHFPRIRKEVEMIFDKSYFFDEVTIPFTPTKQKIEKEKNRKSLLAFYKTFKGVDFSSDEKILESLLFNHPYYNKNIDFFKKELKKITTSNLS